MDTTEIYLSEPSALSLVISNEIDVSCFDFGDGTITADADGGTPINGIPQKYDYTWSNSFNEQIDISTATGLIPGIYTVTAEDANGCTITSQSVYITGPSNPLSILVDSTDETCALNDGSATAFVLGGTLPYAYAWSNTGTANPQVNLAPGLYTVDVTDANGCTISDETFVNGVQNIFLPGNLSFLDSTVCLGVTIFLEIEEKPNLNYEWENGSTMADRWVTPTGPLNVYTLFITDPNCANPYTVIATINVESVDPLPNTNPLPENGTYATILKGASIDIFSDNMNCDIYEWSWIADTVGTRVITDYPDASEWYYIAVDSAGCLGFDSIYVVVGIKPYDAITPNGDGFNDVWNIVDIASFPNAIIQIFNRWGSLVHETSGGLGYIAWDGTRESEELPVGTYYYIIDLNTGDEPRTGPITIIR
jgi:gliding motility-associated-like protein